MRSELSVITYGLKVLIQKIVKPCKLNKSGIIDQTSNSLFLYVTL